MDVGARGMVGVSPTGPIAGDCGGHGPSAGGCGDAAPARVTAAACCCRLLFDEGEVLGALGSWALVCALELSSAWPGPLPDDAWWSCPVALAVLAAAVALLAVHCTCPRRRRASGALKGGADRGAHRAQCRWDCAVHGTLLGGCACWLAAHAVAQRGPQVCVGVATLWALVCWLLARQKAAALAARSRLPAARAQAAAAIGTGTCEEEPCTDNDPPDPVDTGPGYEPWGHDGSGGGEPNQRNPMTLKLPSLMHVPQVQAGAPSSERLVKPPKLHRGRSPQGSPLFIDPWQLQVVGAGSLAPLELQGPPVKFFNGAVAGSTRAAKVGEGVTPRTSCSLSFSSEISHRSYEAPTPDPTTPTAASNPTLPSSSPRCPEAAIDDALVTMVDLGELDQPLDSESKSSSSSDPDQLDKPAESASRPASPGDKLVFPRLDSNSSSPTFPISSEEQPQASTCFRQERSETRPSSREEEPKTRPRARERARTRPSSREEVSMVHPCLKERARTRPSSREEVSITRPCLKQGARTRPSSREEVTITRPCLKERSRTRPSSREEASTACSTANKDEQSKTRPSSPAQQFVKYLESKSRPASPAGMMGAAVEDSKPQEPAVAKEAGSLPADDAVNTISLTIPSVSSPLPGQQTASASEEAPAPEHKEASSHGGAPAAGAPAQQEPASAGGGEAEKAAPAKEESKGIDGDKLREYFLANIGRQRLLIGDPVCPTRIEEIHEILIGKSAEGETWCPTAASQMSLVEMFNSCNDDDDLDCNGLTTVSEDKLSVSNFHQLREELQIKQQMSLSMLMPLASRVNSRRGSINASHTGSVRAGSRASQAHSPVPMESKGGTPCFSRRASISASLLNLRPKSRKNSVSRVSVSFSLPAGAESAQEEEPEGSVASRSGKAESPLPVINIIGDSSQPAADDSMPCPPDGLGSAVEAGSQPRSQLDCLALPPHGGDDPGAADLAGSAWLCPPCDAGDADRASCAGKGGPVPNMTAEVNAIRAVLAEVPSNARLEDLFKQDRGIGELRLKSLVCAAQEWAHGPASGRARQSDDEFDEDDSDDEGDEDDKHDDDDAEHDIHNPDDVQENVLDGFSLDPGLVNQVLKLLVSLNNGMHIRHCQCPPGGPHTCMSPAASILVSKIQSLQHSLNQSVTQSLTTTRVQSRRASGERRGRTSTSGRTSLSGRTSGRNSTSGETGISPTGAAAGHCGGGGGGGLPRAAPAAAAAEVIC